MGDLIPSVAPAIFNGSEFVLGQTIQPGSQDGCVVCRSDVRACVRAYVAIAHTRGWSVLLRVCRCKLAHTIRMSGRHRARTSMSLYSKLMCATLAGWRFGTGWAACCRYNRLCYMALAMLLVFPVTLLRKMTALRFTSVIRCVCVCVCVYMRVCVCIHAFYVHGPAI